MKRSPRQVRVGAEAMDTPLFDLPLFGPTAAEPIEGERSPEIAAPPLPLFPATEGTEATDAAETSTLPEPSQPAPATASATQRLLAGLADLLVLAAVVAFLMTGLVFWEVALRWSLWPGFIVFSAFFSFVYTTVPLAFWGQTPGMALVGIRARDLEDRALSFGQTALRWLAAVASALLIGLPTLVLPAGLSIGDRISHSRTLRCEAPQR